MKNSLILLNNKIFKQTKLRHVKLKFNSLWLSIKINSVTSFTFFIIKTNSKKKPTFCFNFNQRQSFNIWVLWIFILRNICNLKKTFIILKNIINFHNTLSLFSLFFLALIIYKTVRITHNRWQVKIFWKLS